MAERATKRVLIVDDERPARELLKMTLDWNDAGFGDPVEARNGAEALERYKDQRPDLIITDIQMPVMDGLELIRAVRAMDPQLPFIILSCHESFSYAKEALHLGVLDYLIKDSLSPDALIDALTRAFVVPAAPPPAGKPDESGFLRAALRDDMDSRQAAGALRALLSEGRQYFCCAVSPGAREYLPPELVGGCLAGMREALSRFDGGEVCPYKENTFLALAILPINFSMMNLANRRYNILTQIRAAAEKATGSRVPMGVSRSSGDPLLLKNKMLEAQKALESYVFQGKGRTLYYDPAQNEASATLLDALDLRMGRVKTLFEQRDGGSLEKELSGLYRKDLQGLMQYNYLRHINAVLLGMLTEGCYAEGIPYRAVFGADTVAEEAQEELETVEEMCAWYQERFRLFMGAVHKQADDAHTPRLQRILNYIASSYCSDISLESIADTFGIHKVYLAKIFKKETGQSVNEYIRMLRVERAKKLLLQDGIRVGELVGLLGFNNPQTFYNIFKRYVGVNPSEYRESHTAGKTPPTDP